ncbi:hypothetical protein Dimus_001717, partial [Dionaea muscipula]
MAASGGWRLTVTRRWCDGAPRRRPREQMGAEKEIDGGQFPARSDVVFNDSDSIR